MYLSGSQNSKPKALSCQHDPAQVEPNPEPILPPSIICCHPSVGTLWRKFSRLSRMRKFPSECPSSCQYLPTALHQWTMKWVHSTPTSRHPGIQRTVQMVLVALSFQGYQNICQCLLHQCPSLYSPTTAIWVPGTSPSTTRTMVSCFG